MKKATTKDASNQIIVKIKEGELVLQINETEFMIRSSVLFYNHFYFSISGGIDKYQNHLDGDIIISQVLKLFGIVDHEKIEYKRKYFSLFNDSFCFEFELADGIGVRKFNKIMHKFISNSVSFRFIREIKTVIKLAEVTRYENGSLIFIMKNKDKIILSVDPEFSNTDAILKAFDQGNTSICHGFETETINRFSGEYFKPKSGYSWVKPQEW